jgi:hypothetical protein
MQRLSLLAGTVAAALLMGCSGGGESTSPAPAATGGGETLNTTEVVLSVPGMR